MYQIDVAGIHAAGAERAKSRFWPKVSRTVWLLGVTSLLTDVSSEMVSSVLPVYLVLYLGLSPLQYGVVDGLYQGVTTLLRLVSGWIADRWRSHQAVAAAGYGLSAVCKLALLVVGTGWGWIAAVIVVDRAGKGIRTAPRDAMISLSTPTAELGTAFGVHRALDAAGAMLGPLVAFGLLALVRNGFDLVFVTSFFVAVIGFGVIAMLVDQPGTVSGNPASDAKISLRSAVSLIGDPRLRGLVLVGGLLSLATMSDGFVYLVMARRMEIGAQYLPLMYVGTSLGFVLMAVPAGRLADRLGRGRMFLFGHVLLGVTYLLLFLPQMSVLAMLATLLLFGTYYAMTDGVLVALASPLIPPDTRGTGLALLTTATSLGRLLASVIFGALWAWRGIEFALIAFGAALAATFLLALWWFVHAGDLGSGEPARG